MSLVVALANLIFVSCNQPTSKQTRRVSSRLKCFFCAFQCSWRNMWHSIMPLWS